jgi:hypothetical protein
LFCFIICDFSLNALNIKKIECMKSVLFFIHATPFLMQTSNDEHTINDAINDANQTTPNPVPALLSVDHWKHTKAFTHNARRETQTQYYVRMSAAPEVIEMVSLDSKPFGSVSETMMAELFQMAPRTSTQNDGVFEGHKCEIKCARHWAGKDDCRWQHLEPEHDYDFAMLALLDFHEWKVWCISKTLLMGELREKKVVTFQGKQGWWTLKSAIMPYLTPIHGLDCLRKFVSTLPK